MRFSGWMRSLRTGSSAALALIGCGFICGQSLTAVAAEYEVPVDYLTLDNGLRVVFSKDEAVPTVTVAVYYGIGFRIEPRDRTGFAHLFEHMMFQGTPNFPKGEFDNLTNNNGGINNGSTRFDFTNYFEVVPSHVLEPVLWAEADRMTAVDLNQASLENQQGVVKNEVKVNVLNQPYGGFPWLDLPQLANENWFNAHNFYGDLEDLDSATLEDVEQFFEDFYAPNNAVLVVAGDFDREQALGWVEKYFGSIPPSDNLTFPDITEPPQSEEKRIEKTDPLAPQPALAWAYHAPERGTPEWYALAVIDAMLTQGDDSRFYQAFVQEKGYGSFVVGGINWPLGNIYNYNGPMIWSAYLIHGNEFAPDEILSDVDAIIADLQTDLVSDEELSRAMTKIRSGLYDIVGDGNRIGLVDLLAVFALFDDDPGRINRLEDEFDVVTPELIRETAQKFLVPANRSIITLVPGEGE